MNWAQGVLPWGDVRTEDGQETAKILMKISEDYWEEKRQKNKTRKANNELRRKEKEAKEAKQAATSGSSSSLPPPNDAMEIDSTSPAPAPTPVAPTKEPESIPVPPQEPEPIAPGDLLDRAVDALNDAEIKKDKNKKSRR